MHVSRGVSDVEMAIRQLNSRFRRPPQVSRWQWPVISATRPLFYFIRLFGLAPFEISDDHFIPGNYDVIYSLFCTLVHTYILYVVLNKFTFTNRGAAVLDITETSKVIFNYCVVLFNVLVAIWTRKEFIRVLNIVKHFDSRIRDLGHPRTEGAAKVWVWSTGLFTAALWITINRTGMYAFCESWSDNIIYILNYMATSLSTIKFSGVVLLLGQRFRHLNRIAQHSKESATINQKRIAVNYEVIQQLHNSLMTAGESISSQYEWPLLLWLMNLCVHSVSNLYFVIDWLMITSAWDPTRWVLAQCIIWWLVVFIGQLLLLHIACHFTSDEANSMGSIVINWKPLAVSSNYATDSNYFRIFGDIEKTQVAHWTKNPSYVYYRVEPSLHLVIRKLNFSAAGCFPVNLPLLSSISALLTTYLVLLLQFQG